MKKLLLIALLIVGCATKTLAPKATFCIGMTEDESTPILKFLFKHQIKSEFTCRFKWEKGSVAIWDNRCTMHNPINDYHGYRRLMHRISFKGDKPY